MRIYAGENDSDACIKQLSEYVYSSEGAKQILTKHFIFQIDFQERC